MLTLMAFSPLEQMLNPRLWKVWVLSLVKCWAGFCSQQHNADHTEQCVCVQRLVCSSLTQRCCSRKWANSTAAFHKSLPHYFIVFFSMAMWYESSVYRATLIIWTTGQRIKNMNMTLVLRLFKKASRNSWHMSQFLQDLRELLSMSIMFSMSS